MLKRKSAVPVVAYMIVFLLLLVSFFFTYYAFYPYIEKNRSKALIKQIESDMVEIAEKLSLVIERKNKQFVNLVINKGKIELKPYKNYLVYEVEVPYSPYYYSWYDILNNKPMPLDVCEESGNKLVNCSVQLLNADCRKYPNMDAYECKFKIFNDVVVDYLPVKKGEIIENAADPDKKVYINVKPIPKIVKRAPPCSVYVEVLYSQKKEDLRYYIVCNIKKVDETCIIPILTGQLAATSVANLNVVINYQKEEYIPNFNFLECKDAYLRYVEVKFVRR